MRQRTWRASATAWVPWMLVVALAHALDVLTTAAGLRLGIPEGNPIMAAVLQHGELAMYAVKAALVAGLAVAVLKIRPRYPLAWTVYRAMTVVVVLTVVNNAAQIAAAMRLHD